MHGPPLFRHGLAETATTPTHLGIDYGIDIRNV
jgi:hypothetical protein